MASGQIFSQLGMTYDPSFPIEAHTREMVKRAMDFYNKTIRALYMKQNPKYRATGCSWLCQAFGCEKDPTIICPSEYENKIYITGH